MELTENNTPEQSKSSGFTEEATQVQKEMQENETKETKAFIEEEKQVETNNNVTQPDNLNETSEETDTEAPVESVKEKPEEEETAGEGNITDYSEFSIKELCDELIRLVDNEDIAKIRPAVESIRSTFYKKHKNNIEELKNKFLEDGGVIEDFEVNPTEEEEIVKNYYKKFKQLRTEHVAKIEAEKQENLNKKNQIIEQIAELINSTEPFNTIFNNFRDLQAKWREIGPVPQDEIKGLWENYHHNVEKFYDFAKISQELRDLDLKKNLDAKVELCEKAEELLLEEDIIKAFNELQTLHDLYREIGPIPKDKKDEVWERFSEATKKINKAHQDFFVKLKEQQQTNFEAKSLICEKAEELAALNITKHKDWDKKTNEIIELQKLWKTVGIVPKKEKNSINKRFRNACDLFFANKKDFYAGLKEEWDNNLQIKTEICIQAESLQDSTNWKKTTEDLIQLQKKWKQTGPVPNKISDEIWKRFRAACDKFFNSKETHFKEINKEQDDNLQIKYDIIEKIEKFEFSGDTSVDINNLKELQKQWTDVGFVPIKEKDKVQKKYREAINKQFDKLKVDRKEIDMLQFKTKIEGYTSENNSKDKLIKEKTAIQEKISKVESEVQLLENNIGFFSNSKNTENLLKDVYRKIDNHKKEINDLKDKVKIINQSLNTLKKEN